jgi:hypothetical protein
MKRTNVVCACRGTCKGEELVKNFPAFVSEFFFQHVTPPKIAFSQAKPLPVKRKGGDSC